MTTHMSCDPTSTQATTPEKDPMHEITDALPAIGETYALGVIIAAEGPAFSAGHNFGDMAGASLEQAQHPAALRSSARFSRSSRPPSPPMR